MPTNPPPKPDLSDELTERRIAEFALEESRLSNVAYRFRLSPRDRVWKNWDRTEFEPNHFQLLGLAGVCLSRDEAAEGGLVAEGPPRRGALLRRPRVAAGRTVTAAGRAPRPVPRRAGGNRPLHPTPAVRRTRARPAGAGAGRPE